MTPESKIKKEIIAYLDSLGERCWHVAYHNMGYGRYGVPDRLVCYRGRFFAPEVKKKDAKARKRQEIEHVAINAADGLAVVVDSVEQVRALIEHIDQELDAVTLEAKL